MVSIKGGSLKLILADRVVESSPQICTEGHLRVIKIKGDFILKLFIVLRQLCSIHDGKVKGQPHFFVKMLKVIIFSI